MVREHSWLMRICRYLRWDSVAWSLRRLYCPVDKSALVLEVGSGGNPYFRANVLSDAYEDTRQRHWARLVADRPMVIGFVENLPFKNKAFDFVIASHVLEHSTAPERFLSELQRVARAGYIEVPDAFMERINPYKDHRLEITFRDGRLVITKKPAWRTDSELVELYEHRAKAVITRDTMRRYPFSFHVRYYWQDTIDFTVTNPEVDANWEPSISDEGRRGPLGLAMNVKQKVLGIARSIFSQRRRNRHLDLRALLACPACGSDDLDFGAERIACRACGREFPVKNGVPHMNSLPDT